ncbi:MAG TPA: hypothetical protein VK509_24405 [Polyangiales bacterium]|nr:hypothetical protein [Polyangiales bacterium]
MRLQRSATALRLPSDARAAAPGVLAAHQGIGVGDLAGDAAQLELRRTRVAIGRARPGTGELVSRHVRARVLDARLRHLNPGKCGVEARLPRRRRAGASGE